MGQATCVLAGSVDSSLLPTTEFATKVLNKTLSIPITMRAIVKRCLELQRERKQNKIKKIILESISILLRNTQIGVLAQAPELQKCFSIEVAIGTSWVFVKEISYLGARNVDGSVVLGAQSVGLTF